jgi:hypothetical protein
MVGSRAPVWHHVRTVEIKGLNLGHYDPGHIGAVQREIARSVKPNVLRELDDKVAAALLLTTDAVNLSPEAKAYLKELRKRMRAEGKEQAAYAKATEQDFQALLQGLEEFRSQTKEEASNLEGKPAFPPVITLSDHVPGAARPRQGHQSSPTRDMIEAMIYYAPTPQSREMVQRELEVLGPELVAQVKSFGVHIIVLERNRLLSHIKIRGMAVVGPGERTFDGRPWDTVRGLYDQSRRLLVLGEEMLGSPFRSVARHEFAHAFDHAFSEKHRRKLPLSVQLWNLFRSERTGMVSAYASTNPAEYFAESVEAYFQEKGRGSLQAEDPRMFSYLQELFAAS